MRPPNSPPGQVCDHPCLSELSERHPAPAPAAEGEGGEAGAPTAVDPADAGASPAAAGAAAPAAAPPTPGAGGEEEGGKLGLEKLLAGSAKLAMLDRMLQVRGR